MAMRGTQLHELCELLDPTPVSGFVHRGRRIVRKHWWNPLHWGAEPWHGRWGS